MITANNSTWHHAVLHLDMDAFYVNVHILDHPEDADVPLVVGGQPNKRGVVASASYSARQLGIHSAMPTKTAVRLCPTLKIVPANWDRVREKSRQVMEILQRFGAVEKMSVDEAYVDLSDKESPEDTAVLIRTTVKSETQLPCSVGLATSKLVAKVASDHDKPEGCTIVPPGSEAQFLAPLPTRAILGIGPKTAEKLAQQNITTCGQIASADLAVLRHAVGNQAEELQQRAQGIDGRSVNPDRGIAKSISQEWTFNTDVDDPIVLEQHLQKMSQRVAKSLQKHELVAHTVTVKIRWADFTTYTRQRSLEVGIDDGDAIYKIARSILQEHWPRDKKLRLLGVGVSKIEKPASRQLGFNF